MTREEHRAKCIEAMAFAWLKRRGYKPPYIPAWMVRQTIEEQTIAFDSLHGIVRVNPVEATGEMIEAGRAANLEVNPTEGLYQRVFRAMSSRGDLTNQPEKKQ